MVSHSKNAKGAKAVGIHSASYRRRRYVPKKKSNVTQPKANVKVVAPSSSTSQNKSVARIVKTKKNEKAEKKQKMAKQVKQQKKTKKELEKEQEKEMSIDEPKEKVEEGNSIINTIKKSLNMLLPSFSQNEQESPSSSESSSDEEQEKEKEREKDVEMEDNEKKNETESHKDNQIEEEKQKEDKNEKQQEIETEEVPASSSSSSSSTSSNSSSSSSSSAFASPIKPKLSRFVIHEVRQAYPGKFACNTDLSPTKRAQLKRLKPFYCIYVTWFDLDSCDVSANGCVRGWQRVQPTENKKETGLVLISKEEMIKQMKNYEELLGQYFDLCYRPEIGAGDSRLRKIDAKLEGLNVHHNSEKHLVFTEEMLEQSKQWQDILVGFDAVPANLFL